MKRILLITAVAVLILFLTKLANEAPPEPMPGIAFSLLAEHVVQCSPTEITLVDSHQVETHLEKDDSWPDCSTFNPGDVLDFYLSRGAKTKFLHDEKSAWWRKSL